MTATSLPPNFDAAVFRETRLSNRARLRTIDDIATTGAALFARMQIEGTWDGLIGTFEAFLELDIETAADPVTRLLYQDAVCPRLVDTQQAIHGTPITPNTLLDQLHGASFCVSYWVSTQLRRIIPLLAPDSVLLLDNGAFSVWQENLRRRRRGLSDIVMNDAYWTGFYSWALPIIDKVPQAILIIPDVIDGSVEENIRLVSTTPVEIPRDRTMPVWHLHEPFSYLEWLMSDFGNIAFGSSGPFAQVGTPIWEGRIAETLSFMETICADDSNAQFMPRTHMMRGLGLLRRESHPFSTADSTNIARNHCRSTGTYGHVAAMRARIEQHRFPSSNRPIWPANSGIASDVPSTGI
jgi:hypothetical protein